MFPLTKQANRIALLVGITAGTVLLKEVEAAVLHDTEPRTRCKPVVVEDIRFASIAAGAMYLLRKEPRKFSNKTLAVSTKRLDALQHQIARYCNADNVQGYYWSE